MNTKIRYPFLTDNFYKNSFATLDAFEGLCIRGLVTDKDMYSSGTFLTMSVKNNEESKEILSELINNFDAYKALSLERGYGVGYNDINLCVLHEEHHKTFGNADEIKWDSEAEEFIFACMEDEDY